MELRPPPELAAAPDPAPRVSVVIPCRGHAPELAHCLRSLEDERVGAPPFEVVVVDSAADPEVEQLAHRFDAIRVVRASTPLGPGPARNLGVAHARGRYIAFVDADCRVEPDWVASAVAGLDHGARLVGGPVLDAHPRHPVAVADNLLQFSDFRPGRPEEPARYFPACNMAARRADLLEMGGFPEPGVGAGEDTLLCERFLEQWPSGLRFLPGMRVRHDGRFTPGAMFRHQAAFGYARARLGLHLDARQRRLGALAVFVPAVVLRRLLYLMGRHWHTDRGRIPKVVLLLPLVSAGLVAWALGFRRGCREPEVASLPGGMRRGSEEGAT